ncbi:hypothetical protein ACN2WE_05360 [Streptomyces sp. cg28]|uniref:hypothetical protein n=1 Tax=Streptomyces sp. cg28 TaxID=3403457 RepID=UPI003B221C1E
MTPVELPPPSTALLMHESAARIRAAAEKARAAMATNEYWSVGWQRGVANAIGGDEGDLAALFTPELALHLADWLDEQAAANARRGELFPALAVAITAELTNPTP